MKRQSLGSVYGMIFISVFVALMLAVMPLPDSVVFLRPAWGLMICLALALLFPFQFNIGFAWLVGLLCDVISGGLLGEHALLFSIVVFFVAKFYQVIQVFPAWQQAFLILLVAYLAQLYLFIVSLMIESPPVPVLFWLAPILTALLWPWLITLLQAVWHKLNNEPNTAWQ